MQYFILHLNNLFCSLAFHYIHCTLKKKFLLSIINLDYSRRKNLNQKRGSHIAFFFFFLTARELGDKKLTCSTNYLTYTNTIYILKISQLTNYVQSINTTTILKSFIKVVCRSVCLYLGSLFISFGFHS